jgi:hypothetical protein
MAARGTGYVATHATWEDQSGRRIGTFQIDPTAHPWGPDGGPYAAVSIPSPQAGAPLELYLLRYAGGGPKPSGGRGIGHWVEAWGLTIGALRRWYSQQPPGHRAEWDGEPTVQELFDACFSQPRNGSFYAAGGETRTIASAADWKASRHLLDGALSRGELRLGEVWSILLVGHTRPTEFLILWMPGTVVDPGEPEEPVDPEEPEEPVEPTKKLSPVPVRVAELDRLISDWQRTFTSRYMALHGRRPVWIVPLVLALVESLRVAGLLDLALTELVRAKRKLHGEPEEGR